MSGHRSITRPFGSFQDPSDSALALSRPLNSDAAVTIPFIRLLTDLARRICPQFRGRSKFITSREESVGIYSRSILDI